MSRKFMKVIYGSEKLPLDLGSAVISCYILDNKQRVFTKTSFQKALGYDGKSEEWLLDFLSSVNKFYPISGALLAAYEKPILFELYHNAQPLILKGLTPETLIETCVAITNAKKDGYLNVSQLKFAKVAEHIQRFSEQNNLNMLIDDATGFNFFKENSILYLQQFLQNQFDEAAFTWIKTLPEDLFERLFEIHQMEWSDVRLDPSTVGNMIYEIIFSRIPDELVQQLRIAKPKRFYKRKNGVQDNLHPELKIYIEDILSLLNAAGENWNIFIQLLNRAHPKNKVLGKKSGVVIHKINHAELPLNSLDKNLLKGVRLNKIYKKPK
jgi:hypothetical protein